MKKRKLILAAASVLLAGAGILCFPTQCTDGARQGLIYCGNLLIPSIFPFLVLSVFVVKSGLSRSIAKLLNPITRFLFRLPGSAGATVLLGLIGGYPSGARGIKTLLESGEISESQARQMLCFTVGAGPAFVISAVGAGLLESIQAGVILFVSQASAALLLGISTGFFFQRKDSQQPPPHAVSEISLSSALVESAAGGASSMIGMCAFVILFSALLAILNDSGVSAAFANLLSLLGLPKKTASSLLPILLEVTTGCGAGVQAGAGIPLISFALGWAGVCVHFQIFSMLASVSFSKSLFLLFRLLHGLLAAGFAALGLHLFPVARETFFSTGQTLTGSLALNADGGLLLLLLCIVFLLSFRIKNVTMNRKKKSVER